jgi:hypothetical protein
MLSMDALDVYFRCKSDKIILLKTLTIFIENCHFHWIILCKTVIFIENCHFHWIILCKTVIFIENCHFHWKLSFSLKTVIFIENCHFHWKLSFSFDNNLENCHFHWIRYKFKFNKSQPDKRKSVTTHSINIFLENLEISIFLFFLNPSKRCCLLRNFWGKISEVNLFFSASHFQTKTKWRKTARK